MSTMPSPKFLKLQRSRRPQGPHGPWDTPWFLGERFFSIFFGSVLFLIVASFLLQLGMFAYSAMWMSKQDFSKGVIPVTEKLLCGKAGCVTQHLGPSH